MNGSKYSFYNRISIQQILISMITASNYKITVIRNCLNLSFHND